MRRQVSPSLEQRDRQFLLTFYGSPSRKHPHHGPQNRTCRAVEQLVLGAAVPHDRLHARRLQHRHLRGVAVYSY